MALNHFKRRALGSKQASLHSWTSKPAWSLPISLPFQIMPFLIRKSKDQFPELSCSASHHRPSRLCNCMLFLWHWIMLTSKCVQRHTFILFALMPVTRMPWPHDIHYKTWTLPKIQMMSICNKHIFFRIFKYKHL